MSLLRKKREQDSLRLNGLNDLAEPQTTTGSGDSWQTMGMKMPTNYQQPQTALYEHKLREEASMPTLFQQDFHQPASESVKGKMNVSRSIPMTSEALNFEQIPINGEDYKLPEGAYYEEPPAYQLDPATGNPLPESSMTMNDSTQIQLSRCSDPNCSNCKNDVAAK